MSIDYDQLKLFVKEAMFTGGGINEPSAPLGVPHRMPAADTWDKQQDMGTPKANKLYAMAVAARGATEDLIEGLDEPIYDGAYEHAFKASACLRRALNALEESGAHPMPLQRVVAPPKDQQRWGGYVPYQGTLEYGANSAASDMAEATKLELGGAALTGKVQQLIKLYNGLPDKERQTFMAFVMGGATGEK